jgi:hypothetical protein
VKPVAVALPYRYIPGNKTTWEEQLTVNS